MALAEKLTKLGAVNLMLTAAGEQNVSTLVDDGVNDTDVAQQILDQMTIEVLADGWDFNSVKKTLSPLTNGKIVVSGNFLRVDGEDGNYRDRLSVRGSYLYDLTNDTDVFTEDVVVVVTQNLEWEDIPSPVRVYIATAAARRYQNRTIADPSIDQTLALEEQMAWERAVKHDTKTRDLNWIRDSRSTSKYIAGRRIAYGTRFDVSDPRPL